MRRLQLVEPLARLAGTAARRRGARAPTSPAPSPTKARPPDRTSSVATVFAMMPGARKVTGETRVPSRRSVSSPASRPRVTHGSGIGSHARSTWGIWMRWSISAMPAKPCWSAARAIERSQPAGSAPQGKRDTWSTTSSTRAGHPTRTLGDLRRLGGLGYHSVRCLRAWRSTRRRRCGPRPSPRSADGLRAPARRRRAVGPSTRAGTGRSRAALRCAADARQACRRALRHKGARPRGPVRAAGRAGPGRGRGCRRRR